MITLFMCLYKTTCPSSHMLRSFEVSFAVLQDNLFWAIQQSLLLIRHVYHTLSSLIVRGFSGEVLHAVHVPIEYGKREPAGTPHEPALVASLDRHSIRKGTPV